MIFMLEASRVQNLDSNVGASTIYAVALPTVTAESFDQDFLTTFVGGSVINTFEPPT